MKNSRNIKQKAILAVLILAVVAFIIAQVMPFIGSNGSGKPTVEETMKKVEGVSFDADSAYAFTAAQCAFGPRAMNTEGHEKCLEWIIKKFESYGMTVLKQHADLEAYDGTMLKSTNVIARYRPEATTRILLCAHWDSRPWADNDPDEKNWHTPILAANDAASGVAVMLEIARLINASHATAERSGKEGSESSSLVIAPSIGIDFVCFDAEDYGTPQWEENQENSGSSWALGAQYWSENLPQGYEARYGVLLDMVGGEGAHFYKEGVSMEFAPQIVDKVWRAARVAGYEQFFPSKDGGTITDDHVPVNQYAKIPCIDIIPYYPECRQSSFGPTWHTINDNMDHIDRATLKAVGQTLVQLLWSEK